LLIKRIMNKGRTLKSKCGLLLFCAMMFQSSLLSTQVANFEPPELQQIDVIEKLGEIIPLNFQFTNSDSAQITLQEIFDNNKPVIIVLAYYNCPMLCSLVLNGLTESAKAIDLMLGEDYMILTISIEPTETPDLAAAKKESYIKELSRPGSEAGWLFFVADSADSRGLADALGFQYYWDEKQAQWAHPAVLHVMTPEGTISRYLYGLSFKPNDLRLSLLEASRGKIGSTIDRILLYCYHYDPDSKGYVVFAGNVMRLGGLLTVLLLGSFLGILVVRYRVIISSKS
jgi:protein SCO1